MARRRNETGSLLIIALWALLVVGLLALGVSHGARFALRLTEYQRDEIRLTQGAKAAAAFCAGVVSEEGPPVTALNQPWRADFSRGGDHPIPGGSFTVHGFGLVDEEGKVNLNEASAGELNRIFENEPRCVVSVQQQRLFSVSELRALPGMTVEAYERIKDAVTVHGSGRININTAGAKTLEFLGMKKPLIGKIMNFRGGPDGINGTADDGVFRNLAGMAGELGARVVLTDEERAVLAELLSRGRLTVRSRVFAGDFIVRLSDSRAIRRCRVVFDAESGKILSWREEP